SSSHSNGHTEASRHFHRGGLHGFRQGTRIDRTVSFYHDERAGRLAQRNYSLRAGEVSPQRHETTVGDRDTFEMILVPLEGHRLLHLAKAQGQYEPTAQCQLL